MKKSIIIVGSILLIIFLAVRAFYIHGDDLSIERRSYIEKLGYKFSGEIDSIQILNKPHGLVFFHATKGNVDTAHEEELNRKLSRHAELLLLDFKSNKTIEIASETADRYLKGDSIFINTTGNLINVFRRKRVLADSI